MRTAVVPAILLSAAIGFSGCHGHATTSAQFFPSATAPMPGLVKLAGGSSSGSRVVLDVLIYGPEPNFDLAGFAFGVRIGDAAIARFAPDASYRQTALVPDTGQTVSIDVDGVSDASVVRVSLEKQGSGPGNGISGASAVVIELAFDVQGAGATSLTLTGAGNDAPRAFDPSHATIGGVAFDAASATIQGVTTGGSGY